jgi:hypothetical protein
MADTIESLRAAITELQAEFREYVTLSKPVIDGHQVLPSFHGTPEEEAVYMNRPTAIPEFIPPEEAAAQAKAAQDLVDAAQAAHAQPQK